MTPKSTKEESVSSLRDMHQGAGRNGQLNSCGPRKIGGALRIFPYAIRANVYILMSVGRIIL
jgi:hypothetical protein